MQAIKYTFNIRKFALMLFSFMLCFFCVFPSILIEVKFLTLCVLMLFSLFFLREKISLISLCILLVLVSTGLWGSLYGVINSAPGALPVLRVMVIYPVLFFFISLMYRTEYNQSFLSLFLWIALIVGAFLLIFNILTIYVPNNGFVSFLQEQYKGLAVVDHQNGYFKFTLPTVTSVVYFLPFSIALFLCNKVYRKWAFLSICILSAVAILSGRRAIFIMTILGVIMVFLLTKNKYHNAENKIKVLNLISIFMVMFLLLLLLSFQDGWLEFYLSRIYSIFDFVSDDSNVERTLQFRSLMNGVYNAPFWGAGAGAGTDYSRSDTMSWAYELSYVALIYQYGIIGGGIYFAIAIYLIYKMISFVNIEGRDSFYFPFLCGMISFLFANATNPYLGKLDYIWVILFPFIFILKENKTIKIEG